MLSNRSWKNLLNALIAIFENKNQKQNKTVVKPSPTPPPKKNYVALILYHITRLPALCYVFKTLSLLQYKNSAIR